jgi:hypothetical protein
VNSETIEEQTSEDTPVKNQESQPIDQLNEAEDIIHGNINQSSHKENISEVLLQKQAQINKNNQITDSEKEMNDTDDNTQTDTDDGSEDDEENDDVNGKSLSNPISPISQASPVSMNGYTPVPYAPLNIAPNSNANLISLEKLEEQVKQKVHSRKFRE